MLQELGMQMHYVVASKLRMYIPINNWIINFLRVELETHEHWLVFLWKLSLEHCLVFLCRHPWSCYTLIPKLIKIYTSKPIMIKNIFILNAIAYITNVFHRLNLEKPSNKVSTVAECIVQRAAIIWLEIAVYNSSVGCAGIQMFR